MTDVRQYVIDTLRDYKKLKALKKELQLDFSGYLSGIRLDGMPRGTEISQPIETAIKKRKAEIRQVNIEIQRVKNWLGYLDDKEEFYLTELYIDNKYKAQAQSNWTIKTGEYLSRRSWWTVHKNAIDKIKDLILSKKNKPPF